MTSLHHHIVGTNHEVAATGVNSIEKVLIEWIFIIPIMKDS